MSKQEIKQLLIEILIGTTSAVIFCITYHYSPNWIKDFILGIGGSGLGTSFYFRMKLNETKNSNLS